jgi:hypothetical protein
VDVNGRIKPEDIDEWYKWQRSCVAKEIQDENFEMSLSGYLCTLKLDSLKKPPKNRQILSVGKAVMTRQGLSFKGEFDGKETNFEFTAKSIYSLTCSTKGFLEFYSSNDYYMLIPDDKDQCLIKWTLVSEEIHNLYDEKWRKACVDVYDYDKGDKYE